MATGLLDEFALGVKKFGEELAERRASRYEPVPSRIDERIDPMFTVQGGETGGSTVRKGLLPAIQDATFTTENQRKMFDVPRVPLESLYGRGFITGMSDRSAAGYDLTGINNVNIDPINMRGGRDFMFDPQSSGMVWAQENSRSLLNRAEDLQRKTGKNPVFLPFTMSPSGIDFSTFPLDAQINYARSLMSNTNKKKLNRQIQSIYPSFKGIDNPESNLQLRDMTGNQRKNIQNLIDLNYANTTQKKKNIKGGLDIATARVVTSDPNQYNLQTGMIENVGLFKPQLGYFGDSGHPTYQSGVAGRGYGILETPLDVRALIEERGRVLDVDRPDRDVRAAQMNNQITSGVFDDQLLRNLEDKGIKVKSNPLLTVAAIGLGLYGTTASSEAEAGVLSGTQKTISRLLDDYDKIKAGGKGGLLREPFAFKDLTTQVETEIFNALRKQNETFGNKVFDRYKVGPETNIAGSERVKGIARYAMPRPYSEELTRVRLSNPDVIEIKPDAAGAKQFYNSITAAKKANKFGAAVEAYKPSQYKNMRLFLTEDGTAGFALKPNGDLVSAFSDGSNKGIASQIMLLGIEQGAKKLDAYDTILPDLYAQFGFEEASRVKFNPELAADDFDYSPEGVFGKYNRGQPDISFMTYRAGDAVPLNPAEVTSYEEALAKQSQKALENVLDPLQLSRRKKDLSILPAPQRFFDRDSKDFKAFLSKYEFKEGGRYIAMNADLADVTGMYPKQASISIDTTGKPTFNVSNVSRKGMPPVEGNTVKTNLFKKSAGWNWVDVPEGYPSDPAKNFPIISVEDSKGHYYALSTDYPEGVMLERNPATSEPRLRPSVKGIIEYGNVVGQIRTRKSKAHPDGKLHNVYDKITVRNVAPALIAGFAAAGQSEEADASYVGVVSKLGFGRKDFLETAKRMEKQGASNAEIWAKTGWERNQADGKWITELPNTNTKLNIDALRKADIITKMANGEEIINIDNAYKSDYSFLKLRDIVDDSELLDQYQPNSGRRLPTIFDEELLGSAEDRPAQQGSRNWVGELGNLRIVIDDGYEAGSGAYDGNAIYIGNYSTLEQVRGILLHEIQHAIQDFEGFGTGTSVSYISYLRNQSARYKPELMAALEGEVEFLRKRVDDARNTLAKRGQTDEYYKEAQENFDFAVELRSVKEDQLKSLQRAKRYKEFFDDVAFEINPNDPDSVSSHAIYSVFSGEVQARNVEITDRVARIMSGEVKKKGPPTGSYTPPFDFEKTPPSERDAFTTQGGNFTTLPQDKQIAVFKNVEDEIMTGEVKNVPRPDNEFTSEEYDDYIEQSTNKNERVLSKAKPVLDGLSQSTVNDFYTDMIGGPYNRPPSKIEAEITTDVFRFIARSFEDAAKAVVGGTGSAIEPESGLFERAMAADSVFGEYNESTRQVMSKLGDQLGKVLKPAINVVMNTPDPLTGVTLYEGLAKRITQVQDVYYSLPEEVQEEVAPRIGYGALAAMGALAFYFPAAKAAPDVQIPLRPDEGLLQLAN